MRQTLRTKNRVEYEILAEILKELRLAAGLSKEALGKQLDRGQAYIWKIESGEQLPDLTAILDIVDITGGDAPSVIARVQAEAKKRRKR